MNGSVKEFCLPTSDRLRSVGPSLLLSLEHMPQYHLEIGPFSSVLDTYSSAALVSVR